jgi:DNA-binding MarR family transcriptional regulator
VWTVADRLLQDDLEWINDWADCVTYDLYGPFIRILTISWMIMRSVKVPRAMSQGAPGSVVLLTRLSRAIYRRSSESVIGMRLKPYMVLDFLREHGPVAQQALGEAMMLDPNNLVLLLNEVEAAGHASRRRDPDDRRRHIVELTDEGRTALERAEAGMEGVEDEVMANLSPSERATLRKLLAKALESGS